MLPYSRGLILDNTSNYGIVKTEAVFGFGPPNRSKFVDDSFNSTEPLEWIFSGGNFEKRSLSEGESRALKSNKKVTPKATSKIQERKHNTSKKKMKRKGKGTKKCIFKVMNKGNKKNRGGNKKYKKYMMPLILGMMAAKSILVTAALKMLTFISAKGLMMGLFSTIMASVLSLKGMFDHSHVYQNRKDDSKTQVEIIQVPTKSEDHVYYDEHYRRGDVLPHK